LAINPDYTHRPVSLPESGFWTSNLERLYHEHRDFAKSWWNTNFIEVQAYGTAGSTVVRGRSTFDILSHMVKQPHRENAYIGWLRMVREALADQTATGRNAKLRWARTLLRKTSKPQRDPVADGQKSQRHAGAAID
jgi:hypothetical protein